MRGILKNKRGDFTGMLYLVVMIAVTAFFLLVVGYIGTTISTEVKEQIGSDVEEVNDSFDATINTSQNTLSAIWYVVFIGLLMGLLITAWYIPTHPVMVAPFAILLVIAVIVGVAMSNAYEMFNQVPQFSDIADTQEGISWFIGKLPYIAAVVGIIVLIVTFAKPGGKNAAPTA